LAHRLDGRVVDVRVVPGPQVVAADDVVVDLDVVGEVVVLAGPARGDGERHLADVRDPIVDPVVADVQAVDVALQFEREVLDVLEYIVLYRGVIRVAGALDPRDVATLVDVVEVVAGDLEVGGV